MTMSMQGQARLTAAVGTLASLGAPVEATVPAVRKSDGLDTSSIRQGMGISQARFPISGGLARGGSLASRGGVASGGGLSGRGSLTGTGMGAFGSGSKFSLVSDIINIIGAASSIASFLQGIAGGIPQEAINQGGREQQQHETEVDHSKQCASKALDVIDQAHDQCAAASESVVDKVLSFLKLALATGGNSAIAGLVDVVLRSAAKFVHTLVSGRNMAVTGCMKTLCRDMEKPALPGNSDKPIGRGSNAVTQDKGVETRSGECDDKPSLGAKAGADCESQSDTEQLKPNQSAGGQEPIECPTQPAETPAKAMETPAQPTPQVHPEHPTKPAQSEPPARLIQQAPDCEAPARPTEPHVPNSPAVNCEKPELPEPACSESAKPTCSEPVKPVCPDTVQPAGTQPPSMERVQPPALPPQQVPNILCNQPGVGSAQWHGFLKLVAELLCPVTESTPPVETATPTQPAASEPPTNSAPLQQCNSVEPAPEVCETKEQPACEDKPEPEPECETKPEPKPEPACEAEPESECETKPEPKPEPECEEKSEAKPELKEEPKPKLAEPNDKAPSDGYHGFDKTQHPSFPGNSAGQEQTPQLSGGSVVDGPSSATPPPADHHADAPPKPSGSAPTPNGPDTANSRGSWSPDIWLGAEVSAEVQTAGSGFELELAGAAEFGVAVERSGAW